MEERGQLVLCLPLPALGLGLRQVEQCLLHRCHMENPSEVLA